MIAGNGAAAPFELILSVNPLLILLLMPFASLLHLERHMSAYEQLILVSLQCISRVLIKMLHSDVYLNRER